jgi:hypothetical protein
MKTIDLYITIVLIFVVVMAVVFIGFAEGYTNVTEVKECKAAFLGYDLFGNSIGYDIERQKVCIDVVAHYEWELMNK